MHSPHPTVQHNQTIDSLGPFSTPAFLRDGAGLLQQMKGLLEKYYNLSTCFKHERVGEKINDLRNRLGFTQAEENKEWISDTDSNNGGTIGYEDRDSLASIEIEHIEKNMTTEIELNLLTVQTAPLLDRSGRLITDIATLIPNPNIPLMPSPAELSLLTAPLGNNSGIHVYAFLTPERRDR